MSIALHLDEHEGAERVAALVAKDKDVIGKIGQLIELWRYKDSYTRSEICEEMDITERTAQSYLERLRKIGLVMGERSGSEYRYRLNYGGFKVWLREFTRKIRDPIHKMTQ